MVNGRIQDLLRRNGCGRLEEKGDKRQLAYGQYTSGHVLHLVNSVWPVFSSSSTLDCFCGWGALILCSPCVYGGLGVVAAAGIIGHLGSCIWGAGSESEGLGQHVITEIISEQVKWFGSQGCLCVCVCECNDQRNYDKRDQGIQAKYWSHPEVWMPTGTCVCVIVCGWVGGWVGGSMRGLEQHLELGCSLSSSCVQVPATEISRIQRPDTGPLRGLSPVTRGICIVHIDVFPTNGPLAWSAGEGPWIGTEVHCAWPEGHCAVCSCMSALSFCLYWSVQLAVCLHEYVLDVCFHVCQGEEYMLRLFTGWTWGMKLWQSCLFWPIQFDHYLTFAITSSY